MLRELFASILPEPHLIDDQSVQSYESVTTGYRKNIAGVLKPRHHEDITQIVAIARANQLKLYPVSSGRNWGYSDAMPATDNNVILDLSLMNNITDYDAETGLVTIEPGVTQGQLYEFLKSQGGHHVVSVTGSSPEASIIGNYLERGFGLLPVMDHALSVMSLKAVLGDGSSYLSPLEAYGGHKSAGAFRWGIGPYTDGLFFQSAFGIVTRMTIKLSARADKIGVCMVEISDRDMLEQAILKLRKLRESWPLETLQIKILNHYYSFASMGIKAHEIEACGGVEEMCKKQDVPPYTLMISFSGHQGLTKALEKYIKSSFSFCKRTRVLNDRLVAIARHVKPILPQALKIKVDILEGLWNLMQGEPSPMMIGRIPYYKMKDDAHLPKRHPAHDKCGIIWFAISLPFQKEGVRFFENLAEAAQSQYGFDPVINFTNYSQAGMVGLFAIVFDQGKDSDTAQECYMDLLKRAQQEGYLPYRMPLFASEQFFKNGQESGLNQKLHTLLDPDHIFARLV